MVTVKITAHIEEDRQVIVQVPETLKLGDYHMLLVIEEMPVADKSNRKQTLMFANHAFPIAEGETFRRENIYYSQHSGF